MNKLLPSLLTVTLILFFPHLAWGMGQYTEKLVATHYTDGVMCVDSTFEYDQYGNVILRTAPYWREEKAYDSQNRMIARSVYQDYYNEMRLETEEEWAFDSRGNECLKMIKMYSIYNKDLRSSSLKRRSFDDDDRIISEVTCVFHHDAWWPVDSLRYTYDDVHCVWTCFEQDNNGLQTLYEHYYDDMGQDTLICKYSSDIHNEEWKHVSRTIITFGEYGVVCELQQVQVNGFWFDQEKMETEYHDSADSYKKTQWFWMDDDYGHPEVGYWRRNSYEYNYHDTGSYRHIWGCYEDGDSFDSEWEYDDLGRVIWRHYRATSHSYETVTYEYDEWGNVVQKTITDSMLRGLEEKIGYVYTYDDAGVILACEYWYKDFFDGVLKLQKTTVYDFDTSVPASAVLRCPSPYYKLLSVTVTDHIYGQEKTTTYEYASAEEIEGIKTVNSADLPAVYYDLYGRKATDHSTIRIVRDSNGARTMMVK